MDTDILNEKFGEVRFLLDMGDFEKAEDILNEVHTNISKINDSDLFIQYYLIKTDLYRCTRRRELNLNLWNEMERYCITDIHKCMRLSYLANDYLMLNRYDEAFNFADAALNVASGLDARNGLLSLQIKGECFKVKKDWSNAIKMYSTIASIAETDGNKAFVAKYHAKSALMLYEMGYKQLAIDRLFEAEEHANELNNIDLIQKIAIWRADLYRDMGDDKKALNLLKVIAGFNNEYFY